MNDFIIVFGGSFNPITNAHLALCEQIINEHDVHKIIFLPVGNKYEKSGLIDVKHRINMLKKVCSKNPKFKTSDVEAKSEKVLKTIESLSIIQNQFLTKQIVFLLGTDNLMYLPNWYRPEELLQRFKFMVMQRNDEDVEYIIQNNELLKRYSNSFIKIQGIIRNDGSSTYIRNLLHRGKSIRYLVQDEVLEYIKKYNLYMN